MWRRQVGKSAAPSFGAVSGRHIRRRLFTSHFNAQVRGGVAEEAAPMAFTIFTHDIIIDKDHL